MDYSTTLLRLACTLAVAVGSVAACDLPQKNLGEEPGDETGGQGCEPGDQKPADDGCNTCTCTDEGTYACTEIACDPGDPVTPGDPCEPGDVAPADDGCNTCSCTEEGDWACTLLGCPGTTGSPGGSTGGDDTDGTGTGGGVPSPPFDTGEVTICDDSVPFDPLNVSAAAVEGNALHVTLEHGGGCEPHLFGLCWDGSVAESEPPQIWLQIAHDSNDDLCDAWISSDQTFDLSPLSEIGSGTVIIHLDGWAEDLEYML